MQSGQRLAGRFELKQLVGEGAMGEVYLGLDIQTQTAVAIKVLKADLANDELIERFQREGEALRQLNHPNIVKMLGAYQENGSHSLVMEYVGGGSLRELIRRQPQLPLEQILNIALGIADALTRAHQLNIIHRDIKPANVLLADDGTARLSDFGIARISSAERVTETGAMIGTIDYLSPEACRGDEIDSRTDIWSFGVLLYELLTGELPFKGENIAVVLHNILNLPLPSITAHRSDAPPALAALIGQMLSKDRRERIPSARQVGAALEAIQQGRRTTQIPLLSPTESTPTTSFVIAPAPKHNLPPQANPLIGREEELAEALRRLDEPSCRLLTLLAPGGMGKTRLSLAIAEAQLASHTWTDGVFFVSLAPLTSFESIAGAIAEAVGFRFFSTETPQVQLQNYLRDKHIFLVLDNFEHVVAGAGLVNDLLSFAPQLKILATSRIKLNLSQEWLMTLEGLRAPNYQTPEELERYAAVQLFLQSAQRVQPDFRLTPANQDAVSLICQLTRGLPLALQLAAAWLEVLSPMEIAEEIQTSLDFLETELQDVPERQRSIRAVFDYSWNMLTDEERESFARLSVLHGGFTREAAQKVSGASLKTLSNLVNKSLLYRQSSGRYEIHELLRQYAEERLQAAGSAYDETLTRHATFYLDQFQDNSIFGPDFIHIMGEIDLDIENIRCAFNYAVRQRRTASLRHALRTIFIYAEMRALYSEALRMFEGVQEALRDDSNERALYAQALMYGAVFRQRTQAHERLVEVADEFIRLSESLNKPALAGEAYQWASYIHLHRGDYQEAKRLSEKGLALLQEYPETSQYTQAHLNLGYINFMAGRYVEAESQIREALAQAQKHKNPFFTALAMNNLGEVLRTVGQFQECRQLFRSAYEIYNEMNYPRGIAFTLNNLGGVMQGMGDYAEAERMFRRSYELNKKIGDITGLGHSLSSLGNLAVIGNRYEEALRYYNDSLALRRDIGDLRMVADSLRDLGRVQMLIGEYATAERLLNQSLKFAQVVGDRRGYGETLNDLGDCAVWREDFPTARHYFQQAFQLSQEINVGIYTALISANLAGAEIALGHYDEARRRLNEVQAIAQSIEVAWGVAWGESILGFIDLAEGDTAAAYRAFVKGTQAFFKNSPTPAVTRGLLGLAALREQAHDWPSALLIAFAVEGYHFSIETAFETVLARQMIRRLRGKLSAPEVDALREQAKIVPLTELIQRFTARSAFNT